MNDASFYAQPDPFPPSTPRPQWGPFAASELLPRIFQIYGENFAVIFGLSAMAAAISIVVQMPMQLMFPAMAAHGSEPGKMLLALALLVPTAILLSLVVAYVFCLAFGAIFCAVNAQRNGEQVSIGRAIDQTAPRSLRLFAAYILATLRMIGWGILFVLAMGLVAAVIAVVAHFAGISFHRGGNAGMTGAMIGLGLLIVVGVLVGIAAYFAFAFWLYGRYCLFVPVVLAEDLGANASLNRAVEISHKGGRGRIYTLLAISIVLVLGIVVLTIPLSVLFGISSLHHAASVARSPIPAMMNLVILGLGQAFLLYPVLGIGITLCYFDLMARRLPPGPITFEAVPFEPPPYMPEPLSQAAPPVENPPQQSKQ